ncbi:MAG: ATP-binding protein, partial [Candidatus Bathyarchaeota archaeon]|nr:ATP-binding protein [Candidatus Bathyarchaeota archaeon]
VILNKYSNKWYDSYCFPYAEGQVGILFRDITDRKKAEGDLKNSEENYRVYVESSPVPFFVINSKRRYVQVNDAACKLLGYSEKELLKMTPSDIVFEEDQLLALKQLTTLEETGKSIAEFRLKRKDGQAVYVILNAVKLSDGKSMAFCENITELKNLEKQLRDKERLAAVGATAGMVGHDIRNPLQSIVSSLYLIKNDLDNLPDSEEKNNSLMELGAILEEIDYADKIVSDLQDYTRPLKPELVEVNIKTLVTGALSTLNVPNNVEACAFFDEKLPKLRTDPAIMKRVLLNLAINALQAMPEGGKLTVCVGQDKETGSLIIRVEDTGVGIPKDVQNKLFTPLFTTKAKGQGFGLAVVKRLTESLGGTVTFESQEGKGTTFIIRLPQSPRQKSEAFL